MKSLLIEGTTLVSVEKMLETEGWTLESNPYEVIAGIYALAVTNYNNVSRSATLIMTDSSIQARKCTLLAGATANVGVRSTYSVFNDETGSYTQTVSGVTVLGGLGTIGEKMRGNFGWNTAAYNNAEISATKKGFSPGAEFYGEGNNASNVLKYIMGANNPKLTDINERNMQISVNKPSEEEDDDFVSNREFAWSQLDRRQYEEGGELVVSGTTYYRGNYGTSWALSDFSNPEYFDKTATTVSYDSSLDLYTINITLLSDYADIASDFTMGDLVNETKNYIELNNAVYTKSQAKIEVYGSGLIKSIQKMDSLESNEKCKLTAVGGDCNGGGSAANRITYAFSYDKEDCNPLKYVALYWPELGTDSPFSKNKVDTKYKLDLSNYTTFDKYKPVANDLASKFESLYSYDWSLYDGSQSAE